jgi:hypothetical protein
MPCNLLLELHDVIDVDQAPASERLDADLFPERALEERLAASAQPVLRDTSVPDVSELPHGDDIRKAAENPGEERTAASAVPADERDGDAVGAVAGSPGHAVGALVHVFGQRPPPGATYPYARKSGQLSAVTTRQSASGSDLFHSSSSRTRS